MNEDPTPTSPGERLQRELKAAAVARDDELNSRVQMAVGQVRIEMTLERIEAVLSKHLVDDKDFQIEVRKLVDHAQEKIVLISSGINKEQLESRYTIRDMVIGCLAFAGALGVFIGFVGWYLQHGTKP